MKEMSREERGKFAVHMLDKMIQKTIELEDTFEPEVRERDFHLRMRAAREMMTVAVIRIMDGEEVAEKVKAMFEMADYIGATLEVSLAIAQGKHDDEEERE